MFCEEKNCFHIGFVFSLPEVYKILNKNGVKYTINKSAGGEIWTHELLKTGSLIRS